MFPVPFLLLFPVTGPPYQPGGSICQHSHASGAHAPWRICINTPSRCPSTRCRCVSPQPWPFSSFSLSRFPVQSPPCQASANDFAQEVHVGLGFRILVFRLKCALSARSAKRKTAKQQKKARQRKRLPAGKRIGREERTDKTSRTTHAQTELLLSESESLSCFLCFFSFVSLFADFCAFVCSLEASRCSGCVLRIAVLCGLLLR